MTYAIAIKLSADPEDKAITFHAVSYKHCIKQIEVYRLPSAFGLIRWWHQSGALASTSLEKSSWTTCKVPEFEFTNL